MLGGFAGGGPMPSVPRTFQRSFKVFSGAFLESVDIGDGDKSTKSFLSIDVSDL